MNPKSTVLIHICINDSWESIVFKPHTFYMSMKPEISILFSENIRRIRKERSITQEQLAEQAGISTRHLSDIERADSFPSPEVIEQIAKVLDVPSYAFFLPSEHSRAEIAYSERIKKILDAEITKALKVVADKISTT